MPDKKHKMTIIIIGDEGISNFGILRLHLLFLTQHDCFRSVCTKYLPLYDKSTLNKTFLRWSDESKVATTSTATIFLGP